MEELMDEETRQAIEALRDETRMAAIFTAHALALLAAANPAQAAALDDLVTHFDGMAETDGSRLIMGIIRQGHDAAASWMRAHAAGAGPSPG